MENIDTACGAEISQNERLLGMCRADEITVRLDRIIGLLEGKREIIPPTTPLKEKGTHTNQSACACTCACEVECEENTSPSGFQMPSLEQAVSYAATLGVSKEVAEAFWNKYHALGWICDGTPVKFWRSLLKSWSNSWKRKDRKEEERTAHIDAKIEEREKKRQAQPSRKGRKADNWIPPTENERKEFSYDD